MLRSALNGDKAAADGLLVRRYNGADDGNRSAEFLQGREIPCDVSFFWATLASASSQSLFSSPGPPLRRRKAS
jgi:hypothetical protein